MKKLTRAALAALLCLTVSLTVTSCDVLDVDPYQSVPPEAALSTLSGFQSLLASSYDDWQDYEYFAQYYMLYPAAMADNATSTGGARYAGVVTNGRGEHLDARYNEHYNIINNANIILAEIGNLDLSGQGFSEERRAQIKERIRGAAHFIRAQTYFYLVRSYAYEPENTLNTIPASCTQACELGVILRTEPTRSLEQADQDLPRAPTTEVYAQIEADLNAAIGELANPSVLSAEGPIYLPSVAAAQALLAKVYLYQQKWDQAAQMATNALNTAADAFGADLLTESEFVDAMTGPDHPGGIFVVNMDPNFDGASTNSNEAPSSLSYATRSFNFQVIPTADLRLAHEAGDVRLELFDPIGAGQFRLAKYTEANGIYTDDVVVMRVAKVLLIRAEARAMSGQPVLALEDLNTLRTNRGLSALQMGEFNAPTFGGQVSPLVGQILKARRLEFAYEGERFFDLKRRGLPVPKPQLGPNNALSHGYPFIIAPFPVQEVQSNPNLIQNWGYI